jgi:hypothetical protein
MTSTNDQVITNTSITETLTPSPHPSPLGGEGWGEGGLEFGYWDLEFKVIGIPIDKRKMRRLR